MLTRFVTLAVLASTVLGHGYVANVTIDGDVYPGWDPNVDPYLSPTPERIVRQIPGNGWSLLSLSVMTVRSR